MEGKEETPRVKGSLDISDMSKLRSFYLTLLKTPSGCESILSTCEKEESDYWDANQDEPSTLPGGQ